MPKYSYKCSKCEIELAVRHGMTEKLTDCDSCASLDTLFRAITNIDLQKSDHSSDPAPGSIVKKTIKEIREEIKLKREELDNARFEN